MALTQMRAELERARAAAPPAAAAAAAAAAPATCTSARARSPRKGARRSSRDGLVENAENVSENAARRQPLEPR